MSKEQYIKLTLAVYRVTELFPGEDPLKSQIRELANKVLVDLLCNEARPRYIEELMKLFDLAESQNWVDPRNFLVLRREYGKIQKLTKPKTITVNNQRQGKILGILRNNERVKVGDLLQTFPQVSRRTLIRDLEELFHSGAVARKGNGRGVEYNIKV